MAAKQRRWLTPAVTALILLAFAALAALLLRWQAVEIAASAPPSPRPAYAVAAVLLYLFAVGLPLLRRRARRRVDARAAGQGDLLVAYASQTGYAEQLAGQTAASLRAAGLSPRLLPLAEVDDAVLAQARRALFIASTTGEGDAPDAAAAFRHGPMHRAQSLPQLEYAVLALGDRSYRRYCAFGRALDSWLAQTEAQPLFPSVEVNNADPAALRLWQQRLGEAFTLDEAPQWQEPSYDAWQLAGRQLLNPGSAGAPCFQVWLDARPGADWQAGDIADLRPGQAPDVVQAWLRSAGLDGARRVGDATLAERLALCELPLIPPSPGTALEVWLDALPPLPGRQYSIASLPGEGRLELLVRQTRHPDGRLGLGAGWLTEHLPLGGTLKLRLRANPNFHAPDDDRPLILIGNGTGLAGLRALIRARATRGHGRNWLLFGERQPAHDAFYGEQITGWLADGSLAHYDAAWSRDGDTRAYVQDRLREQATQLLEWVDCGASIYVCGSQHGMAPGVDAVLREVLGADRVEALLEQGRYRRDVY